MENQIKKLQTYLKIDRIIFLILIMIIGGQQIYHNQITQETKEVDKLLEAYNNREQVIIKKENNEIFTILSDEDLDQYCINRLPKINE